MRRADVEGWKAIAAYVEEKSGLSFGWEAARKHARRARFALRVQHAGRRVYAFAEDLDAHAARLLVENAARNSDGIPYNTSLDH